jgi:hypothetical protein
MRCRIRAATGNVQHRIGRNEYSRLDGEAAVDGLILGKLLEQENTDVGYDAANVRLRGT